MKCKYCGKKGVSLSHFPKKHGKILRARAAKARRQGAKLAAQTSKLGPQARLSPGLKAQIQAYAQSLFPTQALPARVCPTCQRPY